MNEVELCTLIEYSRKSYVDAFVCLVDGRRDKTITDANIWTSFKIYYQFPCLSTLFSVFQSILIRDYP